MDIILVAWNYVVPFLVVLTVLVFVHEMGHYLVARWCGVRVEVFSIGFGSELYGWNDRVGTRWKLSAIPFGGYVKMFGEQPNPGDDEALSPEQNEQSEAVSFRTKSLGRRSAIVFAGPLANFLLAVVLMAGLFMAVGQPFTPTDISEVVPESAAARAGLRPGDVIKKINGTDIERFEQIIRIVQFAPGRPLSISVEREGRSVELAAVAERVEQTDRFGNIQVIGRLGIKRSGTDVSYVRYDPASAVWRAGGETLLITANILDALWQIIVGTRTAEELGGPIRIAQISGDMWQSGIENVLMFMVILSINLGLINLFPIPMLDGGHLLFYAVEALRGRPIGARAQDFGFRIGIAMVFALMIFVTWNDLVQMRVFDFLVGLVT